MTNFQLSELLEKYIDRKCSPDEIAIIDKWYAGYESKPNYLDSLSSDQRILIKDKMFNELIPKVKPVSVEDQRKSLSVPLYRKWWFRISVAAIVIILFRVVFFNFNHQVPTENRPKEIDYITNNTRYILKRTLSDGSVVWLNPGASLQSPKVFDQKFRKVTMNGECFFEVSKNPSRPFIISSAHIVTKVWGTSFKVVDGGNDDEAIVQVITGKVSVSRREKDAEHYFTQLTQNEVVLKPDQKVMYKAESGEMQLDIKADMMDMERWKHLDLSFDNSRLSDIANELGEKFNVEIKIDDYLKNEQMTADLSGLNLPDILEVLKASMNMQYEISGKQIKLYKINN